LACGFRLWTWPRSIGSDYRSRHPAAP